ncbi:MAG: PEP-CTERM sorting domain-containing protein [Betaproteobacteria bacterium]
MKRLLVAAMLAMGIGNAGASIIVSLGGVVPDIQPGIWDWTYNAVLQPDQNMRADAVSGDFFTIYDVPGLVSSAFGGDLNAAVAGRTFTKTEQLLGVDPLGTGIPDDPTIPNITVRLTGGGDIVPVAGSGPIQLGSLIIHSNSNLPAPTEANYGAFAQQKSNLGDTANIGSVLVPAAAVPEPGSVTLMLVGLVALGAAAFRRRQAD